ncbi:MAG: hypothetical protein ACON5B_10345 [Myxococcota bacterium]
MRGELHEKFPLGGILATALVVGVLIVFWEPARYPQHSAVPPIEGGGMGRLDDLLAPAIALSPGERTQLMYQDRLYEMERSLDGALLATELGAGGMPLRTGVVSPLGDIVFGAEGELSVDHEVRP